MPSASHRLESFAVVTGRLMWIQRFPRMGVTGGNPPDGSKQVVFGEALLRSVEDVVGLPAGNDKKFVVVVVVQRGVWGIPPMEGYPLL